MKTKAQKLIVLLAVIALFIGCRSKLRIKKHGTGEQAAAEVAEEVTVEEIVPELPEAKNAFSLLTPDELTFGLVPMGQNSQRTIGIENKGTVSLEIVSLEIIGENADSFSASIESQSIPVGASIQITITSNPQSSGKLVATLVLTTNDPDHTTVNIPLVSQTGWSHDYLTAPPATIVANVLHSAAHVGFATVGEELYACWSEKRDLADNDSWSSRCGKFNGDFNSPSWSVIDDGMMNYDQSKKAVEPRLTAIGTNLYVTWREASVKNQIRLSKYDTTNPSQGFTFLDGNDADGINFDTSQHAANSYNTVHNNSFFTIFDEKNSAGNQRGQVAYLKANGQIGYLHSSGYDYITVNDNDSRGFFIASHNGSLFSAFAEKNSSGVYGIRIGLFNNDYDNPDWVFIGGSGDSGISHDGSMLARSPNIASHQNKLYLTWSETIASGTYQTHVAVYNGDQNNPTFTRVDEGNLNYNSSLNASHPALFSSAGRLYVIWTELNASGIGQTRISTYNNNDSSPSWSFVDGGGENGINFDPTKNSSNGIMFEHKGKILVSWAEEVSAGKNHVRVHCLD